ncbi:MAG: 2-phosphosulfolactate phosphatase [Candidatus Levybacteria bacterium]|nr:2-phosphosulfolactate phosphatase [Candidatus Levybacteria bacterium]
MRFIITNDKNLDKAKEELVIVIDVLRAFTTACYAINNNPKDYIIVSDIDSAHKLKNENSNYILIGERRGIKIPGFDFGNSPTEIKNVDFSGKTIVHTTTLGTKGIISALKHTKDVITGSFVNVEATINYIKKEKLSCIYLFSTSGISDDNEDLMLAKYIKGYFENKPLDITSIRDNLMKHESGIKYLINPLTGYSKSDFFLALELDKFNFIIKAYLDKDQLIHLKRINS